MVVPNLLCNTGSRALTPHPLLFRGRNTLSPRYSCVSRPVSLFPFLLFSNSHSTSSCNCRLRRHSVVLSLAKRRTVQRLVVPIILVNADFPKGKRYPFIYLGAVLNLIFNIAWLAMPLYKNIPGHFAYFYLMTTGVCLDFLRLLIVL